MNKKSKKYIKRGGYQKKLKKTRRSNRGGSPYKTVSQTLRRPHPPNHPPPTPPGGGRRKMENKANKLVESLKIDVKKIDVQKVENGDDEVCYDLRLQIEGLNKLCGKLINELKDKKEMTCANEKEIEAPREAQAEAPREAPAEPPPVSEIIDNDNEIKEIKKKIMNTILESICRSKDINEDEINSFINEEDHTLNNKNITDFLSRLAKKKFNGMVYGIISKKIAEKTNTAITNFETYFNDAEQQLLISKVQEEIRNLPEIRKRISASKK